jgi:hypothetical protein
MANKNRKATGGGGDRRQTFSNVATLGSLLDRKLRGLYPDAKKRRAALNELVRYGVSSHEPEPERVRLAILKLAGSNAELLKDTVDGAKEDWEDIVGWAERPRESRAHLGNHKLHENQRLKIQQEDREEWKSWLA